MIFPKRFSAQLSVSFDVLNHFGMSETLENGVHATMNAFVGLIFALGATTRTQIIRKGAQGSPGVQIPVGPRQYSGGGTGEGVP